MINNVTDLRLASSDLTSNLPCELIVKLTSAIMRFFYVARRLESFVSDCAIFLFLSYYTTAFLFVGVIITRINY